MAQIKSAVRFSLSEPLTAPEDLTAGISYICALSPYSYILISETKARKQGATKSTLSNLSIAPP